MGAKSLVRMGPGELLRQKTRYSIMESIMSRDNASTVQEICMDLDVSYAMISQHMHVLLEHGILERSHHHTDPRSWVYYVAASDAVQVCLYELFPKSFAVPPSRGGIAPKVGRQSPQIKRGRGRPRTKKR